MTVQEAINKCEPCDFLVIKNKHGEIILNTNYFDDIDNLETYGTDIRSTRSMISARKDVGDLALVFNILKFSDDFMIFIAFEGIDGKWITVWETTIPATNEQELHSTVGKMRDVFKVFETYLSENSIGGTSNLFKRIIDTIQ